MHCLNNLKQLLLGLGITEFPHDGENLPTELEALRFFAVLHYEKRIEKRKSAIKTAKAVQQIWSNNGIESRNVYRTADKIEALFADYEKMRKRKNDGGVRIEQKRLAYIENLEKVLDASKEIKIITANEPRVDLQINRDLNQIPGPSTRDVPLITAENASIIANRHHDADIEMNNDQTAPTPSVANRPATYNFRDRFSIQNIEDEEVRPDKNVCLMFDHIGVSHKKASLAYMTIATSLGVTPENIICSSSTLFRSREKYREEEANSIQRNFNSDDMHTIHWDGKLYRKRGGIQDKRLSIVLSNASQAKLLRVIEVTNSRAITHSKAVFDVMREWNISANVNSMCFDTERTNTGIRKGVCMRLEGLLKKKLIYLPCRHHIYEIVLGAAFETTIEQPDNMEGPQIKIFENFTKRYNTPNFNKSNFEGCRNDRFFSILLGETEMDRIINICRERLDSVQKTTRSDYVELLKLIIIFLSPHCEFHIQAPGAYNRARFMCRIIYVVKIYLYRSQLNLSHAVCDAIKRFLLFAVKIYLRYWLKTGSATKAPNSDLNMLKDLSNLSEVMPQTAKATLAKLVNHLWYLSQTLVAISFFDDEVPLNDKVEMVHRLNFVATNEDVNRAQIGDDISINNLSLAHFVTCATKRFFTITGINADFLQFPPSEWNNNIQYLIAKQQVANLSVVNDAAERSIALYQKFKNNVTKPMQQQYLVQVAEKRRQDCKGLRKCDIIEALQ